METIEIVNTRQAGMYIKHGLQPLDLYWKSERLVFLFDKAKTKPLFDQWCKYELN